VLVACPIDYSSVVARIFTRSKKNPGPFPAPDFR
jgi:hypothetical protein